MIRFELALIEGMRFSLRFILLWCCLCYPAVLTPESCVGASTSSTPFLECYLLGDPYPAHPRLSVDNRQQPFLLICSPLFFSIAVTVSSIVHKLLTDYMHYLSLLTGMQAAWGQEYSRTRLLTAVVPSEWWALTVRRGWCPLGYMAAEAEGGGVADGSS